MDHFLKALYEEAGIEIKPELPVARKARGLWLWPRKTAYARREEYNAYHRQYYNDRKLYGKRSFSPNPEQKQPRDG